MVWNINKIGGHTRALVSIEGQRSDSAVSLRQRPFAGLITAPTMVPAGEYAGVDDACLARTGAALG